MFLFAIVQRQNVYPDVQSIVKTYASANNMYIFWFIGNR